MNVIEELEKLYKKDNYFTVQKIHHGYIVGLTPFNGWMLYGKGATLEEAYNDFLTKRKKNENNQPR